jgi:hypothetical protein
LNCELGLRRWGAGPDSARTALREDDAKLLLEWLQRFIKERDRKSQWE